MSINVKRLVDFLMVEHVDHGGKENGRLLAPWNQLVECGIGRRLIAETVSEASRRGLLDVRHGAGRAANTYTLTFLKTFDGEPPSNRWRTFREVTASSGISEVHDGVPQGDLEVHEGEPQRFTKVNYKPRRGSQRCTANPVVVHLREVHEGEHLSREGSYHGDGEYSVSHGAGPGEAA
jgi:hypothetical protein